MTSWAWTDGGWRHRPWWKVAINSLLRAVQRRGEGRKLVVFTRCGPDPAFGPPTVRGYGIGFIYHLPVEIMPRASVCSPWRRRLLAWRPWLRPMRVTVSSSGEWDRLCASEPSWARDVPDPRPPGACLR